MDQTCHSSDKETIAKLTTERNILLKALERVDHFIDKLQLEQDQIRSCLHDCEELKIESENAQCSLTESSQAPVQSRPIAQNTPVYSIMDSVEENIQAINSQPLTLDLDLDELISTPPVKLKHDGSGNEGTLDAHPSDT
ncbi:hypothetical protein M8J76_005163 [Diaphorina citri]|nr:hypothetical protein M8J76_005163 [Diaphorina citri]KAI5747132.1 hypothetical protein M8J77_011432 [Diaphorina citri]